MGRERWDPSDPNPEASSWGRGKTSQKTNYKAEERVTIREMEEESNRGGGVEDSVDGRGNLFEKKSH